MPQFAYKAYAADDPRRKQEDVLEANNAQEAAHILRRSGFIPVKVDPVVEKKLDFNMKIGERVKTGELAHFTRQMATMIRAGLSSLQALDVLERGTKNNLFKETIAKVKTDINQGAPMSAALAKHPKIFSPLYISLVKAGEVGGVMPNALERLAEQMEKDDQLKKEVRSAMMYPGVVLSFAIIIVIIMLMFVVPAFQAIFESAGGKLPLPTQMLVEASEFIKKIWFLLPLIPFVVVYAIKAILRTEDGRRKWDQFKLNFPGPIGKLIEKIVTARFMRTLATLLDAGVPILAALEIAGPTANNVIVEAGIKRAAKEIESGTDVSVALRNAEVFPDMATSMLVAGEESGEVNKMLNNVASTYEFEVAITIKNLKAIMEPLMMIFIGAIIGVIVVALYMPIFKVYDQIK